MQTLRRVGLLAAFAALVAWLPTQAAAQQVGFAVDGFGGVALPTSNVNDFQDLGPAFGLGVEYEVTDRVAVRGSGGVEMFSGADAADLSGGLAAPDMTLIHFGAGLAFRLSPPDETNWDVSVSIEGGGTSVSTDDFPEGAVTPEGETDFSNTYFSLSPGLRIGYLFGERFELFFRSQPWFALADSEDTAVFGQFDQSLPADGFEDVWSLPVTAGVQIGF